MRILCVTANLPYGTDEAFVAPELRQFIDSGHEVLLVPRSPAGCLVHGEDLIPISICEGLWSMAVWKAALTIAISEPLRTLAALKPILSSRSLLVAAKNLAVAPKALWLARLARLWKADHIHCHWAGTTATMAMIASSVSDIPWSLTAHRWDIVENNILAAKAGSASLIRFISHDGMSMGRELGVTGPANARILHMGVAMPLQIPQARDARHVVLCPARLVAVKGHRFLLEAWRRLKNQDLPGELWLAGDGELRTELTDMAARFGIADSVRFFGTLPHHELLRIYRDEPVSLVVVPSVDLGNGCHEGIPVALVEAMSHGIPVVATDTGGIGELLGDGAGILVPPRDSHALASAIRELMVDPLSRDRLAVQGHSRVVRGWNVASIAEQLVTEFRSASGSDLRPT
jgi:glycosyltransferase involved in cell wall biosynthesis